MKAIVTGDAEHAAHSFDDLPPGAHVAVRASPAQIPDSGIALRLAGFEIRDTIAHIVGDRIVWWILARKPLGGTVAQNVLAHGVGGLNIDACRVTIDGGEREVIDNRSGASANTKTVTCYGDGLGQRKEEGLFKSHASGRFPANVLLDEHAAKEMDEQSGWSQSPSIVTRGGKRQEAYGMGRQEHMLAPGDSGGASRFFPLLDEDGAENWIRRLIDPDQSP